MKRIFSILLFLFLLLASCGRNTKNWPRLCENINADDVIEIEVYLEINDNNTLVKKETKKCSNKENIKKNMDSILYPYEEKICTKEPKDKWVEYSLVKIKMHDNIYVNIKYYSYGVTSGLVSFKENEYHYIPGNFINFYYNFSLDE